MRIFLGTGLGAGLDAGRPRRSGGAAGTGAPTPLRAPRIEGAGRIGEPLALDPGDWRGAERLAFAWLKDGAAIAGAEALAYVPAAADDRAALAAEVTAHGTDGRLARARTAPITIAHAPPEAVAPPPEPTYTLTTGSVTLDISPFFSGSALSFGVTGEGVTVDPETGLARFDISALRSGVTFRLVASNSGGAAEIRLTLQYGAETVAAPETLTAPTISGAGRVGEPLVADPGAWTGEPAIALQWLKDGAPIEGAAGVEFIPGDAEDGARISCRATATNAGGTLVVETEAITVVQAAPLRVEAIADRILPAGTGAAQIEAAAAFSGRSLVFSVAGGGAAVDAATGVITIPTETARGPETVTVTATNSGGAAAAEFVLRVMAAPAALAAPAPAVFALGAETAAIETAAWFSGEDLTFALDEAPAGVTIDADTGRVALPLATALTGEIAVRAANPLGEAVQRLAVRVMAAPAALAAPAPAVFALGAETAAIETAAWFSGEDLAFALDEAPAGVTIDADTGRVALPLATALTGEIAVRAANAAGEATQSLSVRVMAAPAALAAPAPAVFALGAETAAIETAAWFSGEDLTFALDEAPAGVTIDADTGRVALPLATALTGEIAVRATNTLGEAVQRLAVRVMAAPAAQGEPAALSLLQGTGTATLSTQAYFSGEELTFSLDGAPAGVTIHSGSGLVSIATDAPFAGEILVRASNPAGFAVQRIPAQAAQTVSDFSDPAEVAALPFLYAAAAPSWTAATGFGQLKSATADRAHGDWALARGDGRYRALARWSMNGQTMTQARPFGLIGRMKKDAAGNFFGVQLYALLAADGKRHLQFRVYTGSGLTGNIAATATAPWDWDVWTWLEAEFNAGQVRARIYPEDAVAPGWQIAVSNAYAGAGGFGPSSQGLNGMSPLVDIRRFEYHPLDAALVAPSAAQDADWSLAQTMVQS